MLPKRLLFDAALAVLALSIATWTLMTAPGIARAPAAALLATGSSTAPLPTPGGPGEFTPSAAALIPHPPPGMQAYIETVGGCGPYYDYGACVNMRSAPATSSPAVMQLRDGMVLKVATTTAVNGEVWYQIGYDGEIHYPERVASEWWIDAHYAHLFYDPGMVELTKGSTPTTTKRIVVDLSAETLTAYDGDTVFMQEPVSAGLDGTPTPVGTFHIYRKMPDSYMQGPVPGLSDQYYDLPGVPWDLYFTQGGAAIHGTYWHTHFGQEWSHGCVNLPPAEAEALYRWAPLGTPVVVKP